MPAPRRTPLTLGALCAMAAATAAAPASASHISGWTATGTRSQIEHGQPRALPDRAVALQPAPPQMQLSIGIVLRPADSAALQQASAALLARGTADPTLQAQLKARTAPSAAQLRQVQDYLLGKGITDMRIAGNGSLILATASVAAVQAAFDVSIRTYQAGGKTLYLNDGAAKVPTALAGVVGGVLGLDNVRSAALPQTAPRGQGHGAAADSQRIGAQPTQGPVAVRHAVEDLPALYNASALPIASGTTAAIVAVGNLDSTLAHLRSFQRKHNLQTRVTVIKTADPAAAGYADSNNEIEWDMDTQLLLGTAGGLDNLVIYDIPDFLWTSLIEGLQRAADDNAASLVSMSIYAREDSASDDIDQALSAALNQAVGNGQNFLVCSGDDGIYAPFSAASSPPYYASLQGRLQQRAVAFPASHPYAIAVGATELRSAANSSSTYVDESVWNARRGQQISQGGLSKRYAAPSWQQRTIPDIVGNGYRAVPDVSFNGSANSSAMILGSDANGEETEEYVYGTSAATPTFAGLLARLEQANGHRLGFIAPALYAYAKGAVGNRHDVLQGDNGLYADGYRAASGFDLASGWGSIDMLAFGRYLQAH
ncbi:S53 family peptidase [Xanthomonas cerealis]|nr:S53 family peptidase [Xanthomonas translucens]